MDKKKLQADIDKMTAAINGGHVQGATLDRLKETRAKVQKMLDAEEKPSQAPAPAVKSAKTGKRGRPAVAKKEKRAKTPAPAVDPSTLAFSAGEKVFALVKGEKRAGSIQTIPKTANRMYFVRFDDGSKGLLIAEDKISKRDGSTATVTHREKLPTKIVGKAETMKKKAGDCTDTEAVVMVTPKHKTKVHLPDVADPAKGDKIAVHESGEPIAVIKGSEIDKHYKKTGKAKVEQKDGKASFVADPNESQKADQHGPEHEEADDDKVMPQRPTPDCAFVKEEEPALKILLEGLARKFHSGETDDKVMRILIVRKSDKVVFEMKVFGVGVKRFHSRILHFLVCPEHGTMTKMDKPEPRSYKVLFDEDQVNEIYRGRIAGKCQKTAKKLYKECRKGNCSLDERKEAWDFMFHQCNKTQTALNIAHSKWAHGQTRKRWTGKEGGKSYPQVYREVLAEIRASGKELN